MLTVRNFVKFIKPARINNVTRCISNDNVVWSHLGDIDVPDMPIDEFVMTKFHKFEHYTAAECAFTGRKYTFKDIRTKSRNLNRSLRKHLKLERGDVLAILLPNVPEYGIAVIGALKAGLVVTTINPIYSAEEISRQIADSNAKAIITLNDSFAIAKQTTDILKTNLPILTIKTEQGQETPSGAINFDEFTDNIYYFEVPPANAAQTALLPYSSGTTGLPKGVRLSHKNLIANMIQFNHEEIQVVQETTSDFQEVSPTVIPYFHIYGMSVNLNMAYIGCKVVTVSKFSPESYLNILQKHNPSVLYVAPPLYQFLTNSKDVKKEDLESVQTIFCAAAPLGAMDEEKFSAKMQKNFALYQAYGLTETSPTLTITRKVDAGKVHARGSVGKLVASTWAKIVNIDDKEMKALGPNEVGELLVKGPQIMQGYHNRPEETKNAFTDDGWLRTGDLMSYNQDGHFYVKDRIKELIKVKGYQVPPAELEEIIRSFPGVEEAAVIGIPNEKHGEWPRAYVVEKSNEKVDVEKLNSFINSKVAEYKQIKGGFQIVKSIAKNPSGKILRRTMKQEYEANVSSNN